MEATWARAEMAAATPWLRHSQAGKIELLNVPLLSPKDSSATPHGAQDAQVDVGHARAAALPVLPVLQPHIGAARHEGGKIDVFVGGAGATAKEHDGIVQDTAVVVLELIHSTQEVGHLLAQEMVVFRPLTEARKPTSGPVAQGTQPLIRRPH